MEMIYLGKVLVKNTHNRSLVSFSFDSDIQGYMGCSKSLDSRIFLGNCFELRNFKNECGFPDLYCTQQLCTLVLRCKHLYINSRLTFKQHIQSSLFMMSDINHHHSLETRGKAVGMVLAGSTTREAAEALGVSQSAVAK